MGQQITQDAYDRSNDDLRCISAVPIQTHMYAFKLRRASRLELHGKLPSHPVSVQCLDNFFVIHSRCDLKDARLTDAYAFKVTPKYHKSDGVELEGFEKNDNTLRRRPRCHAGT